MIDGISYQTYMKHRWLLLLLLCEVGTRAENAAGENPGTNLVLPKLYRIEVDSRPGPHSLGSTTRGLRLGEIQRTELLAPARDTNHHTKGQSVHIHPVDM